MIFESPLHVGAPNIGDRTLFYRYLEEIFDRRWLTNNGQVVQQFEARLCQYLGVKHCIPMCNGTIALQIAAHSLGLTGEAIVPSLTFIATAHAMQWQGITPVFADVDPKLYTLDPAAVQRHITPRTTAIVATHVYGRPCDTEALQAIADDHGLKLIYDAAHAFGCSRGGRMIANFGDCEVFSFHATKYFNTFEGGAIATNDDALAEKIRLMLNFGFAGLDHVIHLGTNGKMHEVSAAMGLVNLESLDLFLKINQRNYEAYQSGLAGIGGLKLMSFDKTEMCNWQYILVEVGPDYPMSRDELMATLRSNNVLARRYFWPGCHRMEPYRSLQPNAGMHLPVTEEILRRILVLPTGAAVQEQQIELIVSLMARPTTRSHRASGEASI